MSGSTAEAANEGRAPVVFGKKPGGAKKKLLHIVAIVGTPGVVVLSFE